jgi:hypothetical protein
MTVFSRGGGGLLLLKLRHPDSRTRDSKARTRRMIFSSAARRSIVPEADRHGSDLGRKPAPRWELRRERRARHRDGTVRAGGRLPPDVELSARWYELQLIRDSRAPSACGRDQEPRSGWRREVNADLQALASVAVGIARARANALPCFGWPTPFGRKRGRAIHRIIVPFVGEPLAGFAARLTLP